MTAQLIDGNALSQQLRTDVAARTQALKTRGVTPGLAVVLVGDNAASQVYVRNKVKACQDAGLHSVLEKYEATLSEADLLARVEALNNDPAIHGILVQLPLPAHIDAQKSDRSHLARQGCGRLPHRQRGRTHDRYARLLALHAVWLHEDARIHRV